jgi:hypothetical protein
MVGVLVARGVAARNQAGPPPAGDLADPSTQGITPVAAAEHQDLDELSKTTRSGMRRRWQPSACSIAENP